MTDARSLEEPLCPLCRSPQQTTVATRTSWDPYRVVRCDECRFHFLGKVGVVVDNDDPILLQEFESSRRQGECRHGAARFGQRDSGEFDRSKSA